MRSRFIQSVFALMILPILSVLFFQTAQAQTPTPAASDLVTIVNNFRLSKGLPALDTNAALMEAARKQSDYMASIGRFTHDGPGGSKPRDRAISAGYGNGQPFFIAENVAASPRTTPYSFIVSPVWERDDASLSVMACAQCLDIGAAIVERNGIYYYTLLVGYVGGEATSLPPGTAVSSPTATRPSITQTPTDQFAFPTATPQPDGSIIHEVKPGQSLTTIAKIYNISLPDLRKLNNLRDDYLFVGQKIKIRGPVTATPTPLPTATPRPPTQTARPTQVPRTYTPFPTRTPAPTLTTTPTIVPTFSLQNYDRQTLATVIIAVCGIGLVMVMVSLFRKER